MAGVIDGTEKNMVVCSHDVGTTLGFDANEPADMDMTSIS